jgi:hypothetical protein
MSLLAAVIAVVAAIALILWMRWDASCGPTDGIGPFDTGRSKRKGGS